MSENDSGVLFAHKEIVDKLPGSLALDVREDIAGDVLLSCLTTGMPLNLRALLEEFTDKNVKMYVKPVEPHISISELPTTVFGENKITRILDESSLIPFEDRFVIEVD
jgi:hypothetical protein